MKFDCEEWKKIQNWMKNSEYDAVTNYLREKSIERAHQRAERVRYLRQYGDPPTE